MYASSFPGGLSVPGLYQSINSNKLRRASLMDASEMTECEITRLSNDKYNIYGDLKEVKRAMRCREYTRHHNRDNRWFIPSVTSDALRGTDRDRTRQSCFHVSALASHWPFCPRPLAPSDSACRRSYYEKNRIAGFMTYPWSST